MRHEWVGRGGVVRGTTVVDSIGDRRVADDDGAGEDDDERGARSRVRRSASGEEREETGDGERAGDADARGDVERGGNVDER